MNDWYIGFVAMLAYALAWRLIFKAADNFMAGFADGPRAIYALAALFTGLALLALLIVSTLAFLYVALTWIKGMT